MNDAKLDNLESELATFYNAIKNSDKKVSNNDFRNPTRLIELLEEYREDRIDMFMEFLERNYLLWNRKEIISFIKRNPDMIGFCYDVTPILKERFPNKVYELRYDFDVEIDDYDYFFLSIGCDFSKEDRNEIVDRVLNFGVEINPIKRKYDVFGKFIVDVVSQNVGF